MARQITGCNLSKNTIWKQITTRSFGGNKKWILDAIYQRTQSESKSQLALANASAQTNWMQSIKEHNLKANHNYLDYMPSVNATGCNLSKNTIWKQITTLLPKPWFHLILDAIYQRTQSESKSQQFLVRAAPFRNWMQSIKEHNLKANHNVFIYDN